jgi:DNA-directed RNA polymerase subunit RPC12/RpoP
MKCLHCNNEANIVQADKTYLCDRCFAKMIEKRVRKDIRINKLFRKNDRVLVVGDIAFYFVNKINYMPIKIFKRNEIDNNFVKKNKINKIVVQDSLDDVINIGLKSVFGNRKIKKSKDIIVFRTVTDKELSMFAKIIGMKFKENKKDKKIQDFINKVEDVYSDTKYKILRSIISLE